VYFHVNALCASGAKSNELKGRVMQRGMVLTWKEAIALLGCITYFLAICFIYLPGKASLTYTGLFVDDTFIFFRYAEHLASGLGFVWNPGEPPVEGFSSIGWVLVLGLGHRLTDLPIPTIALWAGVAFAGITIILVWITTCRLLEPPNRKFAILAPIVLATTPLIARHACSGMETTMVMCAYATLFMMVAGAEAPTIRGAAFVGMLSGLFYLIRPDAVLVGFLVPFFVYAISGPQGMSPKAMYDPQARHRLLAFVLVFFIVFIIMTSVRWWYFGSFLPPPAYMKLGVARSGAANTSSLKFIFSQWAEFPAYIGYLLMPIAWGMTLRTARRPLEIALLLAGAAFAIYQLQVIPIMNFQFRFFTPLLALLSILAALACVRVGNRLATKPYGAGLACFAFVAVSFLVSIGNLHSSRSDTDPHFDLRGLAEALRDVGPITIAYSEAGVVPFYSKQRFIDYAGLNDLLIARNRDGEPGFYWPYIRNRYGLPDVYFAPPPEYASYASFGSVPEVASQYELSVTCGVRIWILTSSRYAAAVRNALKQVACHQTSGTS
jgi:arabinofuranosyltransferase